MPALRELCDQRDLAGIEILIHARDRLEDSHKFRDSLRAKQQPTHRIAELLASLKLTEHLGAADAWCVDLGAEDVADLKDEDLAEQLAEVL